MSIVRQENGTYNLVDNHFGFAIANGTKEEMLLLKYSIEEPIDEDHI